MQTMVMEVTPAQAKSFLDGNTGNRHLRKSYVDDLAAAILRGEWKTTHQGIAISVTGRLLDGQHRCAAIVQAGVPVQMMVSFDVPDDTFSTLDAGLRRTATDLTGISKIKVAALRWFYCMNAEPFFQRNAALTAKQISETDEWAGAHIQMLLDACGSPRRYATTSPIVAGAAIRVGIAANPWAVCDAYRAFVLMDYPNMPPGVQSLERSIVQGTVSVRGPKVALFRAFHAFALDGRQTIQIKNEETNLAMVQSAVRSIRQAAQRSAVAKVA